MEKTLALPQLQLVEKSVTFSVPLYLTVTCTVPYSVLLGSTVDTHLASVYEAFLASTQVLRSCSSSSVVDILLVPQRHPHGPDCSADHRHSSDAVRFQVVDAPVVQVVRFHRLFISVYSALLGSTADTCGASVYGVFHILRELVDYGSSGRFSTCSFQRLLGSTVNTSLCVSLRGWSSWSRCTSRCIPSLSSGS